MVLSATGAGILDQGNLYADCHAKGALDPTSGWLTAPDGLEWTLNDRRPTGADPFQLVAPDSEPAVSRAIVWSIYDHGVAPIALINGWAHWVVVHSVTIGASPASADDSNYEIESFFVHDPFPTLASAPPPPHSPVDGCKNEGFWETHYSYDDWVQNAMTGVSTGYWKDKYLSVLAAEPLLPPKYWKPRLFFPKWVFEKIWRKAWPPPLPPRPFGRKMIDADEARQFAKKGIARYGLFRYDSWSQSRDAEPDDAVLVRRLHRKNEFYYVVTLSSGKQPQVRTLVDAHTGKYLLSTLVPAAGASRTWLNPAEAQRCITDEKTTSKDPYLVWQPCLESPVPYFPFHRFTTVSGEEIYVRVDGEVFPSLTDVAGA